MNPSPLRHAARALPLDPRGRILLVHIAEADGFWATPGGSLEDGEDHHTALRRELAEELGLRPDAFQIGDLIATRSSDHLVAQQPVRQVEHYYLVRLTSMSFDTGDATQPDNIVGYRWWTTAELRHTDEVVYPHGLAELLAELANTNDWGAARTLH
ncbi:NUDIX hydrolase [Actinomadura hibisca]|uniref:NUDIX hydrolase n=1 Tax=Actinomadura hibisca TaxID=68565 RepID=UPI0009FE797C|nr:NUDIX domain-containing protein [Actinomadura hibisca]